ncbi:hypothetical protein HanPI659440_Chr12g0446971 [Helianthus annuus]|nr:hypothetical protein HanPI659440_Chr12g0446971 [Helianthus annuus]
MVFLETTNHGSLSLNNRLQVRCDENLLDMIYGGIAAASLLVDEQWNHHVKTIFNKNTFPPPPPPHKEANNYTESLTSCNIAKLFINNTINHQIQLQQTARPLKKIK